MLPRNAEAGSPGEENPLVRRGTARGNLVLMPGLSPDLSSGLSAGLSIAPIAALIGGLRFGVGTAVWHGMFRPLLWRYGNCSATVRSLARLLSSSENALPEHSVGYVFIREIVQGYFCDAVADQSGQEALDGPGLRRLAGLPQFVGKSGRTR